MAREIVREWSYGRRVGKGKGVEKVGRSEDMGKDGQKIPTVERPTKRGDMESKKIIESSGPEKERVERRERLLRRKAQIGEAYVEAEPLNNPLNTTSKSLTQLFSTQSFDLANTQPKGERSLLATNNFSTSNIKLLDNTHNTWMNSTTNSRSTNNLFTSISKPLSSSVDNSTVNSHIRSTFKPQSKLGKQLLSEKSTPSLYETSASSYGQKNTIMRSPGRAPVDTPSTSTIIPTFFGSSHMQRLHRYDRFHNKLKSLVDDLQPGKLPADSLDLQQDKELARQWNFVVDVVEGLVNVNKKIKDLEERILPPFEEKTRSGASLVENRASRVSRSPQRNSPIRTKQR